MSQQTGAVSSIMGGKKIVGYTDDGESASIRAQRVDVKKALCSVHKELGRKRSGAGWRKELHAEKGERPKN